ncbi:MAG: NADPH:quinone reductase-like Zn-dependent oxidoreductase [Gammaproteobacteria bacterium]|jgi:NADPH:quinone reductase-like Zn-dependent oxidoreductase
MKVIELRSREGIGSLVMGERAKPKPGPGEILVRINAVTLNYRDLAIVQGSYGSFALPIVPASDACGEVVETGQGVTRFQSGDTVCPLYVMDWLSGPPQAQFVTRRLGGPQDGVLAEYVCTTEQAAVRAPRHMSAVEAASLPIAGVTAWQALFVQGRVTPGDVVVVQGTGGVSIFALQLARGAGARVIATTSSDDKARRATALGATEVINYREHADWQEQVMSLTDGRGADHVIDVVGGTNIDRSIGATRIGGTVSLIGFLEDTRGVFNLPEAFRRVVTLNCISVGSRSAFEALVAATEAQQLKPVISRVFAFDEIHNAYEYLASGTHIGKVAIELA